MFSKYRKAPTSARKLAYAMTQLVGNQALSALRNDLSGLVAMGSYAGINNSELAAGLRWLGEDRRKHASVASGELRDRAMKMAELYFAAAENIVSAAKRAPEQPQPDSQ